MLELDRAAEVVAVGGSGLAARGRIAQVTVDLAGGGLLIGHGAALGSGVERQRGRIRLAG